MLPPTRALRCLVVASFKGRNRNPCTPNHGVHAGLRPVHFNGICALRDMRSHTGLRGALSAFLQGEILAS